jgi:predicted extracellular nuclease
MNIEPNETFFVNVTNISGASVLDAQGLGTIVNDDVLTTPIHTIQGAGSASPFAGQQVTTTISTVTAKKTNGFFIQTPTGNEDSDPNTSEGIFVFTSSAPTVSVGDNVRVTGTVVEFFQLTEINTSGGSIVLFSTGNPLPAPVTLTTSILDASSTLAQVNARLESLEGMRVFAGSLTSVSPTNEFGEFYTVITGVARPFREPGVASSDTLPPGVPCCVPIFDENPERLVVDSDGLATIPRLNVTSNVTATNVTGPLDFTFDEYKLLPETTPVTTANMTAVAVPEPCAGEFTIASFNMERFFDTVNDPGTSDAVLSPAEFATKLSKASLAIRNVMRMPDIIGVQEAENLSTLQAIATQINNDAVAAGGPNPNYQVYLEEGNDIGGIDVGFLVKTSRVTVIDVVQEGKDTTFTFNGVDAILNDRPPLVLRAVVTSAAGTPSAVTVIVNHLRSLIGIEDPVDGPRVRAKRSEQANFLATLIQTRQANNPSERVISVGDYNAFQFNDGYVDVMGAIKGMPAPFDEVVLANSDVVTPDLINLTEGVPASERYSFVFEGSAQVLDHILMTQNLQSIFSRIHYARNDADFPESLRNDPTRSERISDHDMPVAYFRFPMIANVSVNKSVLWPPNHKMVDVTVNYDEVNTCGATTCTLSVTSNEPVNGDDDGNTAPDWEVLGPHNVRLRAERSGTGTGRVYTITINCTDSTGHSESRTVTVTVPLNRSK